MHATAAAAAVVASVYLAPALAQPPCDITGTWTGFFPGRPLGDEYYLSWRGNPYPPTAFTAVMVESPQPSWSLAEGTVDASGNATIVFDSGVALSGTLSNACARLDWNNTSFWVKVPAITTVHVVSFNHFDCGYNGIAPTVGFINNVLNRYFVDYFPRAIAVAQALRALGGEERLVYTSHPFLLSLYLDCPANFTLAAGITLACPSADDVAALEAAVQRGDITWHAGPMNMQFENMGDARMVNLSLSLAKDLATRLGVPAPTTLSQRDVPGTTRSIIPVLAAAGVTAMSEGVNNAVPPPSMSLVGGAVVWRDPVTQTQMLYLQHNGGYPDNPGDSPSSPGGLSRADCVVVPGYDHALAFAFRTDNSGPPESVDEVLGWWDILRGQFPGAQVVASTLDNFTSGLLQHLDLLPVVAHEVGDTWLEGVPSDPPKMSAYREMVRALLACVDAGQCDMDGDVRLKRFLRLLIKAPEHTWGLPSLDDDTNWTNAAFMAARAQNASNYANVEAAWGEQRDLFIKYGLVALADHPLADTIRARLAALTPVVPAPSAPAYQPVPQASWTAPLTCGGVTYAFDGATGGLQRLSLGGKEWADATHLLGTFQYQTYNDTDFAVQQAQYQYEYSCCFSKGSSQRIANPQRMLVTATMDAMWASPDGCSALVQLSLPPVTVAYYGAPAAVWVNATVVAGQLDMQVTLVNKTATRLAEALWFAFEPAPQGGYALQMDKLGLLVDPLNVTLNGSQHQHGIAGGVLYTQQSLVRTSTASGLVMGSLDAPVVSPVTAADPPTMLPAPMAPLTGPVTGAFFALSTNTWNTNYIYYSAVPGTPGGGGGGGGSGGADYAFRFYLQAATGAATSDQA